MARFRRSGTNWEGRAWKTSPALNSLMDEIEEAYPERHSGDGTVASKNHDAISPVSDPRPYPYTGPGVVNAVDAGETVENDGWALAEAIRSSRDPRVRYVQHEGSIFSSYSTATRRAWEWGPVGGNPHVDHVHVSVLRDKQNDGRLWNLGLGDDMASPKTWDAEDFAALDAHYQGSPGSNSGLQLAVHGTLIGRSGSTLAAHLQKTLANTQLLVGEGVTDEDVAMLVELINELPDETVVAIRDALGTE
jgi:hypothetical protein